VEWLASPASTRAVDKLRHEVTVKYSAQSAAALLKVRLPHCLTIFISVFVAGPGSEALIAMPIIAVYRAWTRPIARA
jgi:hypothetical protein